MITRMRQIRHGEVATANSFAWVGIGLQLVDLLANAPRVAHAARGAGWSRTRRTRPACLVVSQPLLPREIAICPNRLADPQWPSVAAHCRTVPCTLVEGQGLRNHVVECRQWRGRKEAGYPAPALPRLRRCFGKSAKTPPDDRCGTFA
jgi:hypothetical protein